MTVESILRRRGSVVAWLLGALVVGGDRGGEAIALELYDGRADPSENVNIASDPARAELVEQLTSQMNAGWRAATPDARK